MHPRVRLGPEASGDAGATGQDEGRQSLDTASRLSLEAGGQRRPCLVGELGVSWPVPLEPATGRPRALTPQPRRPLPPGMEVPPLTTNSLFPHPPSTLGSTQVKARSAASHSAPHTGLQREHLCGLFFSVIQQNTEWRRQARHRSVSHPECWGQIATRAVHAPVHAGVSWGHTPGPHLPTPRQQPRPAPRLSPGPGRRLQPGPPWAGAGPGRQKERRGAYVPHTAGPTGVASGDSHP